ncbi:Ubiquitin conjugating enzyme (UbcF) [Penicillium capsulatum]|nr:Ubiquitin conjugating enzyme (UbcF) [Penicillium capsulatum]
MTSTRRLLKESTDLHKNPSPYFTAAPISDENLHDWHFTLAGPPSPTPYATGLYHGRITFPQPTLYAHQTWQPAWGVRTALLAIRSEIMGAESKGQVGGMEVGDGLRREYARLSRAWMCRECGTSNDAIMKELWGECTARGVEVDVEGFEGEPGTDDQQREETGTAEKSEDARGEAIPSSTPTSAPVSAPLPASAPAPAPAPSSHAVGQTVPRSTPAATGIPSATTSSPAATPSSSVWLDRAIIGIVIALVILILRRVADVDDL